MIAMDLMSAFAGGWRDVSHRGAAAEPWDAVGTWGWQQDAIGHTPQAGYHWDSRFN